MASRLLVLESQYEPTRDDDIVDARRWRRDRKVARAGIDVSHFGAKSQPSDGAHVNPAAELNRIRVGVLLRGVRAPIRAQLRFGVPGIAGAGGTKYRDRAFGPKRHADAGREV